MVISRAERIAGGLYGLLIGDALGLPYEGKRPEELPSLDQLGYEPPSSFLRSHVAIPPATWSDDGSQALCLLASLVDRGRLDPEDLGRRLLAWHDTGYMAVDGRVFGAGGTTSRALSLIRAGRPALDAGLVGESFNSNGSLMRVLPLALWHSGDDEGLAGDAALQSRVTHGNLLTQVCCALYCLWARKVMDEEVGPWAAAVKALGNIYLRRPKEKAELHNVLSALENERPRGTGYVVDCLASARWAAEQGSYEQVVRAAIALGNDTDTTACVAGGIAGLRSTVSGIPEDWLTGLRGKELVQPLLERLLGE